MSGEHRQYNSRIGSVALAAVLGFSAPVVARADTAMTAGVVLQQMPVRERAAYIMGIVEGLAYARFRKDTIAAGTKTDTGMSCVYDWFYRDTAATYERIEATFRKYADHHPSTLLAAMIKKECGE